MVAASSMVAAVEGLQSRLAGGCNVSQKMTEQLAQTIRCDPVSSRAGPGRWFEDGRTLPGKG